MRPWQEVEVDLQEGQWAEVEWSEQWMQGEKKWMDQEQTAELILDEGHLSCEENENQEVLFLYYQEVHLFQEMIVKTQNLTDLNHQETQF